VCFCGASASSNVYQTLQLVFSIRVFPFLNGDIDIKNNKAVALGLVGAFIIFRSDMKNLIFLHWLLFSVSSEVGVGFRLTVTLKNPSSIPAILLL